MLRLETVSKAFGSVVILDRLDLDIEKGSIVGLAGPSGSGKSTLLRLLQKLEKPDSGIIHCNGRTGFMFQDFQLFPHMTVLDNVLYAPRLRGKGVACLERASVLLEHLGLTSRIAAYPRHLSGGQKQRVALARTLMMEPDIVLCDEPTSGLDVASTSGVAELLGSVRDMGVTMVIASHDLDFLTRVADRVVLLRNGRIAVDTLTSDLDNPVGYLESFYQEQEE